VLLAMGVGHEPAYGAIRVSLGAANTAGEIDAFAEALRREVESLRRTVLRQTA
jgi:cysteine desulfurase